MSYIRNKILAPLNDLRNRDYRLRYFDQTAEVLSGDEATIRDYQVQKVKHILAYAQKNCEYYKNTIAQSGIDIEHLDLQKEMVKIPILEKDQIRNNFEKLQSNEIKMIDIIKTATGGTTSSPISFLLDRESFSRRRAATLYFFKWFNYELGDKIAYLWGAEQDYQKNQSLKARVKNYLIDRSLSLQTSYLNDAIMRDHYKKILKFRPKVLQAYPTPLYIFADFLEKNNLKLHIDHINVTAEYLYDNQRKKIESVFGVKIFNWYGARELGHIATECSEHGGMHINVCGLYVEVIKNNKAVYDELGELVITDLWNKAMPLIRYRIGDIGMISRRKCRCISHLPLLEEVGGRYVDTFKKRDGTYIPGIAFTNRIINECKGIKELQIIQEDYEKFNLKIVKGEHYSDEELRGVQKIMNNYFHQNLDFTVEFLDSIPREKSGKIRFCKSLLD